jgi:hypothetical protein
MAFSLSTYRHLYEISKMSNVEIQMERSKFQIEEVGFSASLRWGESIVRGSFI